MAWRYHQGTGRLERGGVTVATGYSGAGNGRNNPGMESMQSIGPIPRGNYRIETPRDSAQTGPHVMPLTPVGHNALGRTSFQIHGDNATNDASTGCIILPRSVRDTISLSGDNELEVVE